MKRRWLVYASSAITLLLLLVGLAGAGPGAAGDSFAPSLLASPRALDFGPVGVGELSDPIAVTFNNLSNTFISPLQGGAVGAPFLSVNQCDAGLPAHTTCQFLFRFAPETAGEATATVLVESDAGQITLNLRGLAVGPRWHVNPLSFDFGLLPASSSADEQTATITNDGLSPLGLFEITTPGAPFSIAPNCPAGLSPGDSCPLVLDFTTSAISGGFYSALIDLTADGQTRTLSLMGSAYATPPAAAQQVTPRAIDFGPAQIGAPPPTWKVTVYNRGETEGLVDWETGALAPPFAFTTNCQDDIDPATYCEFTYTFDPTAAGVFTATHQFSNNLGSMTIELRGEGVEPQITADGTLVEMEPVAPGQTSPDQTVTIKNTGIAPLPAMYGGATGTNEFGGTTTCGGLLLPGQTCQFYYNFQPESFGRFSGVSRISLTPTGDYYIEVQVVGGALLPELALAFGPPVMELGNFATLYIDIDNPNPTYALGDMVLMAELPPGLVVADPPAIYVGPDCGGASFQPVAGGHELPFSGEVAGGHACQLKVNVTTAEVGTYPLSGHVTSDHGPSEPAAAQLVVQTEPPPPPSYKALLPFLRR